MAFSRRLIDSSVCGFTPSFQAITRIDMSVIFVVLERIELNR